MKICLFIALTSILITASLVLADDDPQSPWPVVENCVSEPTQPPSDWTYSGTLLMAGYAGIHAMQADWETPRVVASFYTDELGEPIDGGQLSPDGRWYAAPIGETFYEASNNQYWIANGLRLYSTIDDVELQYNLSDYDHLLDYDRLSFYGTAWTYEAVRWIDNDSLIEGSFLFRPFDAEVRKSTLTIANAYFADFEVAPNWTRVYGFIQDDRRTEGIFDPESPNEAIAHLQTEAIAWLHDSSGFIGEQRLEAAEQLSLFNHDGEFVERLFVTEGGHLDIRRPVAGRNELGWSADDRYFAFVHNPPDPQDAQLILLDRETETAMNTCLNPVSQPVWSPDSSQIAVLMRARENLRVVILDFETWTAYDVARHSGISGALRPDMLAWRSND